jgi:hypothetical protein
VTGAPYNSGSRSVFNALTSLIWIALPANAALYALAWGKLPARVATHFDFANHPNGWMSREGLLIFSLLLATVVAGAATWILSRSTKPDPAAWALLIFFYVIAGVLLWAANAIVAFNVEGRPVNVAPGLTAGMLAAGLLMVITLGMRRGPEFRSEAAFADEIHSSGPLAALLGVLTAVFTALLGKAPNLGLRLGMSIPLVMMVGATALAWNGFHYLFSPAGVEIRTMGFRLRSIGAGEIQSYAVDHWDWLGGYGIRGVGNMRAYVWSNTGVRIKTSEGEVFLGHSNPEKIVRDLDRMTRNHEARGA